MLHVKRLKPNQELVEIDRRIFFTKTETRGARPKFWIVGEQSKGGYYSYPYQNLLLKFNRNNLSQEHFGEVLYYAISKEAGARCVEYQLAEYTDEYGNVMEGVACPSYKTRDSEYDLSAYDLMRYTHDLSTLEDSAFPINTIDSYLDAIPVCSNIKRDEPLLQFVERDLTTMAIMDYLTGQTDRHWGNISFLFTSHNAFIDKTEAIKTASAYDNGCCFSLKRKNQALETLAGMLNAAKKDKNPEVYEQKVTDISKKLKPMLGVKTPLVRIADKLNPNDDPNFPKKVTHIENQEDWEETFLDEICEKVHSNKWVKRFIENLKHFNFDNVLKTIESQGDDIPKHVLDLSKHIFEHRYKTFFSHLEKYSSKAHGDDSQPKTIKENEGMEM